MIAQGNSLEMRSAHVCRKPSNARSYHLASIKSKNFISSCLLRVPVMVSARDLSLTKKTGPYNWPTVLKFIVNFVNKE